MTEEIKTALEEICSQFADKRVQHCQVEAATIAGHRCELAGSVLDEETLTAVTEGLAQRFPQLAVDAAAVQILRQSPPMLRGVATNVTGLHGRPSFGSEMLTQLLAGWTVERLRSEDKWLFVRQPDGYLGWAYEPFLGEAVQQTSTHLVAAPVALLRASATLDAPLVSRLLAGTPVLVGDVRDEWACIETPGFKSGWLLRSILRAVNALPANGPARREQITQDAQHYIGIPYLWGGITAFGLDCSGYVQLLHRLAGLEIPRDADMQFAAGQPVEPPLQPGDLLFFGSERGHRSISHVALGLGGWQIIHASRAQNGVYVEDMQANDGLRESFLGARTFVSGGRTG